jgi:hypothetical protein
MALTALEVISTEDESVHIRATDEKLPVNIYVERADIDDYLGISDRDAEYKRDFILQNIDSFRMIADARYREGSYEKGHSDGTDFIRINLTMDDLRSASLIVPRRRLG